MQYNVQIKDFAQTKIEERFHLQFEWKTISGLGKEEFASEIFEVSRKILT